MAVTQKLLTKFCRVKMKLTELSGSRHDTYCLVLNETNIPLPELIRIPRHNGSVSRTVLKSTAADLGLRVQELESSTRCHIGKNCILLALAGRLIKLGVLALDGSCVFPFADSKALAQSIQILCNSVADNSQWSETEKKLLLRVLSDTPSAPKSNPLACARAELEDKILRDPQSHASK